MNVHPSPRDDREIVASGRRTFAAEAAALAAVGKALGPSFATAVRAILECRGSVLVTGLGKSGLVARKVAATLTATGTPSVFIHPVEATHGDLGIVRRGDVLVAISRSGNNREVNNLIAPCRQFGLTVVAITGHAESELGRLADVCLPAPVAREACPLGLTPTSSATAAAVMGDALALALLELRGFTADDFAAFHPSGALGRSLLLRVRELMHTGPQLPVVSHRVTLRQALPEIVGKRLGGTCVVDDAGVLVGLCVDGDVKRALLAREDALDRPITESMTAAPTLVDPDALVAAALRLMEQRPQGPVTLLIAVDAGRRPVGLLHIHDVLRAGLL